VIADGGTDVGSLSHGGSGLFEISVSASDADIVFKGNDGGAAITALTLDMSQAGKAIFNDGAEFGANIKVTGQITHAQNTARMWVMINGGGTPSARDSFNVSSIGDWGTGDYGVYIDDNIGDNYSVVAMANDAKAATLNTSNFSPNGSRVDIEVRTIDSNFSAEDVPWLGVVAHGDYS